MKRYLFLMFLLTGCLRAVLPISRLESPETSGHLNFRIKGGVGSADSVIVSHDPSKRPPETYQPYYESTRFGLPLTFGFGLTDLFEFGLQGAPSGGPIMLKGKFQLFGTKQKSEGDGMSIAISGGVGFDQVNQNGDQDGYGGNGGNNWNAKMLNTATDGALIFGYRFGDFLVFGGPFVTTYKVTADIHQDASTSSSSPAADYRIEQVGQHSGANAAVQWRFGKSNNMAVTAEVTAASLQWTNKDAKSAVYPAACFDFVF